MSSASGGHVLIVDDHLQMARVLAEELAAWGHEVEVADSGEKALAAVRTELPDLVITDLRMEGVDGFDVIAGVHAVDPHLPVIVMTAFGAVDSAVEAMKRGAWHYLVKPFRLDEVKLFVERALAERRVLAENATLRREAGRGGAAAFVGGGAAMRAVYDVVARVAPTSAPVLITGESGTGKELVARALHDASPRARQPFIPVNCTAIPEALLESELFGHTRGAFSGATAPRRGLFVEADGGTLFLDEIGDMPATLQPKLLRVLQDGQVRAVGSDHVRRVDVRVVAATNQDLEKQVAAGRLRADLYFRLDVVAVRVPPLRERPEDVRPLVEHFLRRARERYASVRARAVSAEVLDRLGRHGWPGNVRELENLVERLAILAAGETIGLEDLERHAPGVGAGPSPLEAARSRMPSLKELEDEYIAWVLARCGGNKTRAAEVLGIDASTIYRRERERERDRTSQDA